MMEVALSIITMVICAVAGYVTGLPDLEKHRQEVDRLNRLNRHLSHQLNIYRNSIVARHAGVTAVDEELKK